MGAALAKSRGREGPLSFSLCRALVAGDWRWCLAPWALGSNSRQRDHTVREGRSASSFSALGRHVGEQKWLAKDVLVAFVDDEPSFCQRRGEPSRHGTWAAKAVSGAGTGVAPSLFRPLDPEVRAGAADVAPRLLRPHARAAAARRAAAGPRGRRAVRVVVGRSRVSPVPGAWTAWVGRPAIAEKHRDRSRTPLLCSAVDLSTKPGV